MIFFKLRWFKFYENIKENNSNKKKHDSNMNMFMANNIKSYTSIQKGNFRNSMSSIEKIDVCCIHRTCRGI